MSQKYIKGNVAVMPQESVQLRQVLPPSRHEISDAMCALFVGWKVKPTRENVASLKPVLVSKQRVQTSAPQCDAHLDTLLIDTVGYAAGDYTPKDYKLMKAQSLSQVLDGGNFLKMQSGSQFINDRDQGLMSYLFPHLDPWGIGGFNEPNHRPD
ncbi:hypothetical protein SERLA73DRAFT_75563 [Serpula lacrymans var. lacrymans S7.3]|uniref:DUF6570 domain-containing protein n=2 Tax=Serpula lacrymans var. lacrymans TaxID=341189 RepID=F8Q564_SERL3|nr:uncharacterized protein SERLADRAFT_440324 [Serpula lacrymans var. lacrymans S7.9]EGN96691.1 hypothetical protein SERLA73DRAFT_75563 [Serpula lacrymans var. lacrymans S7.3]EGO22309.1 hypothetical protein SERLADRAFT_440324 [Serpula lacrymans var. lacrymans S7.9]